jgi:FkbM family methyltransferase
MGPWEVAGEGRVAVKDVLFYDAVGMPYTGTTLRTGGLGGTEQNIVLLAEELAKEGLSVTVATKTAARTEVNGVEYVPLQDAPPAETLVHLRYGDLHCVDFYKRRILFCTDSVDISVGSYDKYGPEFRKNTDLVVVCRWQLDLFKQRGLTSWKSEHVITGILPDSVLAQKTGKPPKYPHRFVYASAARKGLRETLEAWSTLDLPADAELWVTNPGYDARDVPDLALYRRARWAGVLPSMDAVADLIAESAGLFYVNTFAECTSITLAMCEALGRRVHMLCLKGLGGVRDTVTSRLVTDAPDDFRRDFAAALANPELARWYGEPKDFSAASAAKAWLPLVVPATQERVPEANTYKGTPARWASSDKREVLDFIGLVGRHTNPLQVHHVFDLGSRDCVQALELAKAFPNALVHAFECNPHTLPACEAAAATCSRVRFTPKAVHDHDGTTPFYPVDLEKDRSEAWPDGNPGMSSLYQAPIPQQRIEVPCVRLDTYCSEQGIDRVDVVWADLQGAELLALSSLGDVPFDFLHTEVSYQPRYRGGAAFPDLDKWLCNRGMVRVTPTTPAKVEEDIDYVASIPLRIHHVWAGLNPFPYEAWRQTWMQKHPDADFRFWRGTAPQQDPRFQKLLEDDRYTPVVKADVLRWGVLLACGGVYVDTDMECINGLAASDLRDPRGCFVVEEEPGRICNAIIGATPNHPFVQKVVDALFEVLETYLPEEINRDPIIATKPGSLDILSRLLRENADLVTKHTYHRFYPLFYNDKRASAPVAQAVCNHHWAGSWKDKGPGWREEVVTRKSVAVIIPCFNQAQFLPDAVASVRTQTRPPKEIIVVCGDAESVRVASTLDVRWTRDPGYGLAHARNLGISFTNCPLIFPLDADDTIEPTCLEKMTREADGDHVIVASWMQEFGESNGHLDVTEDMLANGYTSPMCLFSRKLWELTGGYDVASPIEDWAFWLDCHKHSPVLRLVKERLVRRRMHPKQATKVDPYELFMSVDRWLRPDHFERTERDERNVASPVIQRWVSKRLRDFPDNEKLRSLVRPASFQTPIQMPPRKLGLCMIVRNESKVIERCLKSVRPLISHWTVVDTGSTDGTQALVRKVLEGVPGELYERPWVDFSTNRNQALALAEGHTSHVLVIDADDVLEIPEGFRLPELTADCYRIYVHHGDRAHWRPHIFRPEKFRYRYVIHEGLYPTTNPIEYANLDGPTMKIVGGNSHRNRKANKFLSDVKVIKRAMKSEPDDTRYAFYLAQSWRDAFMVDGNFDHLSKALKAYARRGRMGGNAEEMFLSLLEIARIREKLGHLRWYVEESYRDAFGYRSFRAEPLYHLARWLRMKFSDHTQAVVFARHAASLPKPLCEELFIEADVYEWRALDEFVVCTTWLPHLREEGRSRIEELLSRAPPSEHERIRGMK